MANFDALPRELKIIIFKLLIPEELKTLTLVSKEWYDLSYDPTLWPFLCLFHQTCSPNFSSMLSKLTLLKKIDLIRCANANEFLILISKNCSMLEELLLSNCKNLDSHSLCTLAKNTKSLHSLGIQHSMDSTIESLNVVAEFKNLIHLDLFDCGVLNDEALINISKSCGKLKDLNIDQVNSISDLSVVELIKNCHGTLKRLLLDGEKLTDLSYNMLHHCNHLKVLSISYGYHLGDSGIRSISLLPGLLWLKIGKCDASCNAFLNFFNPSKCLPLIHLELSDCSLIDDNCIKGIMVCCPVLHCFLVSWSYLITEEGMVSILRYGKNIRCLTLLGLLMLDGTFLSNIVEEMPKLSFLNVHECNAIDGEITHTIKCKKPSMEIVDIYGDYETLDCTRSKFYYDDNPSECIDSKVLMDLDLT